ncbi:MAG TPA: hypothetical protein VHO48_10455 [Anaerolineaceae bacterium]|nr:hypothetical protein [Anaerolineaceae bacterium]
MAIDLSLVAAIISVLAAVASAWFARKNNVRNLQNDIDILAENAEKVLRTARTARMREVRAATRGNPEDAAPPPELQQNLTLPTSPQDVKKALREKVFGRGVSSH